MLFGSGNLIFPMLLGKEFPGAWSAALIGWIIAAVLMPLFGYFGAILFDADHKKYLAPIGKYLTEILMLIIMLIAGPFGAVARNINVSFGGMHVVLPDLPNFIFNLLYCMVMIALSWNPGKLVKIIGVVFTPMKFGGVAIVMLGVLFFCDTSILNNTETLVSTAFIGGFKTGYQTMDLLAGFIMSSVVFLFIKNALPEHERENKALIIKFCGYSCCIGGIALSIIYAGLVFASAKCSGLLIGTPDEELFAKAAAISLGNYASWFVAVVIAVCCLATNIALTSIFADYVHKTFFREKFNRKIILILVGGLAFVMSLLGFSKLCSLLGMILEKIYPAIILFVVLRVIYYYYTKYKT
jgi:LIVCS family branched-chain amino acid:cation transporter